MIAAFELFIFPSFGISMLWNFLLEYTNIRGLHQQLVGTQVYFIIASENVRDCYPFLVLS